MSLINIPQKAFNLITDKKKRDNQIVRALSQVVENLLPDDIQNNLKDRLAELVWSKYYFRPNPSSIEGIILKNGKKAIGPL